MCGISADVARTLLSTTGERLPVRRPSERRAAKLLVLSCIVTDSS